MTEREPKELHVSVNSSQIRKDLNEEITEKVELQTRVKELEQQLADKETQRQQAEERANKQGGAGTLPANLGGQGEGIGNNDSGLREWNSFEEMVDELRMSKDPKDKEALNALFHDS